MKFSQLFITGSILTALLGCTSNQTDFSKPNWRPFLDIDGTKQEISFFTFKSLEANNGETTEKIISRAYIAQPFGELKAKKELGEIYPLGKTSNGIFLGTIFKLKGNSLNIYDNENIKLLAQSKSFDFYEFGAMRLTHAKFTAQTAICEDFNRKSGVDLLMVSNYYPQNSFTDFYTALINVKLQRSKLPKKIGYKANFTGDNLALQTAMKNEEKENGQKLVAINIREKADLLFNIICK